MAASKSVPIERIYNAADRNVDSLGKRWGTLIDSFILAQTAPDPNYRQLYYISASGQLRGLLLYMTGVTRFSAHKPGDMLREHDGVSKILSDQGLKDLENLIQRIGNIFEKANVLDYKPASMDVDNTTGDTCR